MSLWVTIGCTAAAAVIAGVAAALIVRQRDIAKAAYMMDALEDGELNFRFRDSNRLNRTLNRIRTIFEQRRTAYEQESWEKLIRVLTHEIMNTVAPIASLSDALSKSVNEGGHSELDIRAGLETIADSSNNLIKFVQTYRELSGIARPARRSVVIKDMIENVITLNSEFASSSGTECRYTSESDDLMIYADEGQISQIIINLIKNAIQAGARNINLNGRSNSLDEVIIEVSNDGKPIPLTDREQIFVPFFTTKSDGSGIGLSISRQIMRNHNGTIDLLRSDDNQTAFVLIFR